MGLIIGKWRGGGNKIGTWGLDMIPRPLMIDLLAGLP
jgi:hypothetical protein